MKLDVNGTIHISDYENVLIVPFKDRKTACKLIDDLAGNTKPLTVEVAVKRKQRSLTANAYLWVLCTKIAKKMSKEMAISKEDVYKELITKSNYYHAIPIAEEAVNDFIKHWQANGIGYIAQKRMKAKTKGYWYVYAYYGSSTYNTKEMSELIDMLIQDAKALGIETMPPAELQALKESWHEN